MATVTGVAVTAGTGGTRRHGGPQGGAPSLPQQVERALRAIRGITLLGLVVVAVYGAAASARGQVLQGIAIALFTAGAAFAVGGLLGFLFGMPRRPDAGQQAVVAAREPGRGPGAADTPRNAGAPAAVTPPALAIRPNTSLERISEWLTTLIAGLGIANFRDVFGHWTEMSLWVTGAIAGAPAARLPSNGTPGAILLLVYGIGGFMMVYLWSQRYLGLEWHLAEHEAEMDDLWNELRDTRDVADLATMLAQGAALYGQKEYERAARVYADVLAVAQDHPEATMGLALAKSYLPAPGPAEALKLLDAWIAKGPKEPASARAYYNKACILAAEQHAGADQVLPLLQAAIALDEPYRAKAQKDEDFRSLADDAAFKALVAGPPAPLQKVA